MACLGSSLVGLSQPFSQLRHSQLALADLRVLLTCARVDAAPLAASLIEAGAHPLWAPTVRVAPLTDEALGVFDDSLMRLGEYDVIMFPDRHALDAVVSRGTTLADGDKQMFNLMLRASSVEVAAAGALSTQIATALDAPATIVPLQPTPDSMAASVQQLKPNARVLLPTADVHSEMPERSALTAALEASGAVVTQVAAYELTDVPPSEANEYVELRLLSLGDVDALLVGSAAEARSLCKVLQALSADVKALPLVAALGQDTATAARAAGLDVGVTVDDCAGFACCIDNGSDEHKDL
ncbi:MAG: hypothetical protein SGPRY_002943 [Prymnesium sp.]